MLSEWLHHFLVPLVAGGDVRVSRPLGAVERRQLCDSAVATDDERTRALAEARQAVAAEILVKPREPVLDDDTVTLGVAVNNLLFLSHPATAGALIRKSKLRRIAEWSMELVESLGPPEDAVHLVARHTLLSHLFDLGRDDVRVSFWAGRRDFRGSEPPSRLYRWSKMRRVREERTRVLLVGELLDDHGHGHGQQALLEALLRASPLTDLLDPIRTEPSLELEGPTRWLADPMIARAVAERWLACGLSQVALPVCTALLSLCNRKGVATEARLSTQFICHLQLLWLVGKKLPVDPVRLKAELTAQGQTQPAMIDWYGIFVAAAQLGLQRPHDLGARFARLVDDYAAACAGVVGSERILEIQAALVQGTHAHLKLEAAS